MPSDSGTSELHRGLGVWQATALNVANMVGIGPFITIPGFLAAMHGPQALVAWVIAALLVLCDGLVWSELGAALPGSGGSYHFLSEIFGRLRFGRIIPFLFIWQFMVSGTLELASGYIGAVDYLAYPFPGLNAQLLDWGVPQGTRTLAAATALVVVALLCRHIRQLGWLGLVLCAGTLLTALTVIVAGYANFDGTLIQFPESFGEVTARPGFYGGLGGAMTIAIYDYLGYYNICHLGDEVVNPGRTIPRAVMFSVVIVAALYLTMNLAIIGVVPWEQAMQSRFVASEFMELLFGRRVAEVFTVFILWTVVACVFSMTLGYSRIPYAAARHGHFFRIFSVVHPVHRYPVVSLLALGGLTAVFCYFPLQEVIDAAVVVRILVQFVGQIVGLHVLRTTRPDVRMPFRMWFYPLPSLLALAGWMFLFATAQWPVMGIAAGVLLSGALAYFLWNLLPAIRRDHQQIITGRWDRPALLTGAVCGLLRVASIGYGLGVRIRNLAYDRGWLAVRQAPVPVLSLGNLTAGGTGKTPAAAYVADWFQQRGIRVAFVSRGYGAEDRFLNDEGQVLAATCPGVPHVQIADRFVGACRAVDEHASQLIVLDDGFQHRRLARDLDVVLIDATNPWGPGDLLPRGLLREPRSELRRANLVWLTRVNLVPHEILDSIRRTIAELCPGCPIAEIEFQPLRLINARGATTEVPHSRGVRVAAFCGIGNPAAFEATLTGLGVTVAGFRSFPDHHHFTAADLADLEQWVRELTVDMVLCTQKDLVKIPREELGGQPLWGLQIGTRIVAGENAVQERLQTLLAGIASR